MNEVPQVAILLALGSNLGDRRVNLKQAREELSRQVTLEKCSSIYETPPWGYLEQPAFLNQVLAGKTEFAPKELLCFLKSIETKMGRVKNFKNGPRIIDLDILLFGNAIVKSKDLVIPHPRMLERGFVLIPLAEIEPELIVPGTQLAIKEWVKKIDAAGITKVASF